MLNEKTNIALNKQIALEGNASAAYLAMAAWCERQGLKGCALFFYEQSAEERMHMMKIILYINEESDEFLKSWKISELLNKYCKFLPAAIKFGTTPIKASLMFLNKTINIAKIPIMTNPKVKI